MSHMSRRAGGIAGALCLAGLASSSAQAQAPAEPFELADSTLSHRQSARVTGSIDPALAGGRVALEHRAAGSDRWQELVGRAAGRDGNYRLTRRVPASGALRVNVNGGEAVSPERPVRVAAGVAVHRKRLNVPAGRRAAVSGAVRPATAGLGVALQIRRGGGWATIDRDRTGPRGRYALADRRSSTMSSPVRVRVTGQGTGSTTRSLGRLNVYRSANASWYGPGLYGNKLGCGGTLSAGTLGVAHKSLPCGTKVTLRKDGRSVRVPVIDRGPYVGGREYDLTAATAQKLGFNGHGPIQVTR